MDHLVSILIPTYNNEVFVQEAIKSALDQTYNNIEIIVVDNNSTDGTWEVLQEIASKYNKVKVFRNEKNFGPVRNWIITASKASGYYGKIIWSDDLIRHDFLEKTIPLMKEDVGFVYSPVEVFCEESDRSYRRDNYITGQSTGIYDSDPFIDAQLTSDLVPNSPGNALFRLKDIKDGILEKIENNYGEDFASHSIGIDRLIFLFALVKYEKYGYVNEKLAFFRDHNLGITPSSSIEKLTFMHALAKAMFVANYAKEKESLLNVYLQCILDKFPDNSLGISSVSDFYLDKHEIKMGVSFRLRVLKEKFKSTQLAYYLNKLAVFKNNFFYNNSKNCV